MKDSGIRPVTILRDARERLGLSQSAMAERLNVSQPTVQGWESGKKRPNVSRIARVASAYRVDVAHLLRVLTRKAAA